MDTSSAKIHRTKEQWDEIMQHPRLVFKSKFLGKEEIKIIEYYLATVNHLLL